MHIFFAILCPATIPVPTPLVPPLQNPTTPPTGPKVAKPKPVPKTAPAHIGDIRKLLNWTQDELSQKIGVSRPTIVNIEKDPTKMSKIIALALFTITFAELSIKATELETIDFSKWKVKESREELITSLITSGIINKSMFASLLKTIPVAGTALSLVITHLFSKSKLESANFGSGELKEAIEKTNNYIALEINKIFDLDTFDLVSFVNKIENTSE